MNLYTCDAAGHVTSETWYADSTDANAGQNPLDTLNYSYDGAGNLVAESDNASAGKRRQQRIAYSKGPD